VKLAPPPSKTPLFDNGSNTLNHVWQRWLSELYLNQKETTVIEGVAGASGRDGQQGAAGSQGLPGEDGTSIHIYDGGAAATIYLPSQQVEGGSSSSIYYGSTVIDCGGSDG